MNLANQPVRDYSKAKQLYNKPVKLSQKQMGDISTKVRKQVNERSQGICEVDRPHICSHFAAEMAHITGRKQLKHATTAADLLHACIICHRWLDETPEGIKYKRLLNPDTDQVSQ